MCISSTCKKAIGFPKFSCFLLLVRLPTLELHEVPVTVHIVSPHSISLRMLLDASSCGKFLNKAVRIDSNFPPPSSHLPPHAFQIVWFLITKISKLLFWGILLSQYGQRNEFLCIATWVPNLSPWFPLTPKYPSCLFGYFAFSIW